jgi:hypothetical protein
MLLAQRVEAYCCQPVFFSDPELSDGLAANAWNTISSVGISILNYHTGACLNGQCRPSKRKPITDTKGVGAMYLEYDLSGDTIDFLMENELTPITIGPNNIDNYLLKLISAMGMIEKVPAIYLDVTKMARMVIVIDSPDLDFDVSYSHPNIPFSIFVSTCQNLDDISNIRVAESIIHEAMHLKLSMMETLVPMLEASGDAKLYSPWRLGFRPVQGVLHGLFVFRMLYEFYLQLHGDYLNSFSNVSFIEDRLKSINGEIDQVYQLVREKALTKSGEMLVANLLKRQRFKF